MESKRYNTGGMWEESYWEIYFNKTCGSLGGGAACKHCTPLEDIKHDGWIENNRWSCPRVIVGTNEGGHNSTGICADCVLEALTEEARDEK